MNLESHFSMNDMCEMMNLFRYFLIYLTSLFLLNKKCLRCNESLFITKQARKEIMKITFLQNKCLKIEQIEIFNFTILKEITINAEIRISIDIIVRISNLLTSSLFLLTFGSNILTLLAYISQL